MAILSSLLSLTNGIRGLGKVQNNSISGFYIHMRGLWDHNAGFVHSA